MKGVVLAHYALQLRKFADHVGGKIGLGKSCGPLGIAGVDTHSPSKLPRKFFKPCNALGLAANFVVIDNRLQGGKPVGKRPQPVLIKEKFRIGKPRANHPLVAFNNFLGVL